MTELIKEKTNIKRSEIYEDCDEFIYVEKYLKLDRKDFCCEKIYEILLGEIKAEYEVPFI